MKTSDFSFDLPEGLIAQYPTDSRGTSRLLVLDRHTGERTHTDIGHLAELIPEDALLVINNSKVRKARVFAKTAFEGQVEFLFLEQLDQRRWKTIVTKSKRQKTGRTYTFAGGITAELTEDLGSEKIITMSEPLDEEFFLHYGHMPLPPYIKREDEFLDDSRYQTVYAKEIGSVAAPTAGLHVTRQIIDELKAKGVRITEVTLHVGLGTFLPIRSDDIHDHAMHTEEYEVSAESAELINQYKREGRPIYAVGTTSVRTLEAAYDDATAQVRAGRRSTDIFIKPGYTFKVIDALLTNFHTPESTLLILVSALAGKDNIFAAYAEAIEQQYRFFSYGDAMLIR